MRCRLAGLLALLMSTSAGAQWLNHPDPTIPRLEDGKPNLSAAAPRTSDGKPDLSGVWQVEPSTPEEIQRVFAGNSTGTAPLDPTVPRVKYRLNILADFKREEEPMRPEAAALFQQRLQTLGKDIPTSHCLPGGIPFSTQIAPFKFVQTPRLIVMLLEDNNPPRQIYLDGRMLPVDPHPTFMGYSAGTWQGDTLVVDSSGFNDRTWLDGFGHPHSEALHLVERFRRRDFGHMDVEVTVDDPKMYTRTFTIKFTARLLPDTDILESVCAENEKDRVHLDR
jgi:hypothetical protein